MNKENILESVKTDLTEEELEFLENNIISSIPSFSEWISESEDVTVTQSIASVDVPIKTSNFGKATVFHVCSDDFNRCKNTKNKQDRFSKYIQETGLEDIRLYAKSYPSKSILIHDEESGAYTVLKLGKDKPW